MNTIKKIIQVGIGKIKSKLTTGISKMTGRNFTVPVQIYWNMSNKCNFQCWMCSQWKRGRSEDAKDYLNFQDMQSIVDQMKKLKIRNLGITGGEPLLQKKSLFQVLAYANRQGIYTHFGSNGWLIDEAVLREYDRIGGGHISLSIDAIGNLHDEIRGISGAFEHILRVLELYKKIKPENVFLKINTVMSARNLKDILPIVELTEKYAAAVFIQPFENFAHDTLYEDSTEIDKSFTVKEADMHQVNNVVAKLKELKKQKPGLILNSQTHLDGIINYFANRTKTKNICEVAYKKFTIHPFGDVLCCGYLGFIGNVKKDSIAKIWNSAEAAEARKKMKNCRYNCMQGCFFEPSLKELLKDGFYYLLKIIKKINEKNL